MIQENLKLKIKELSALINAYVEDKQCTSLVKISTSLANYFDAQTASLWTIDSKNERVQRIDTAKETILSLETSLIKRAIDSKEIFIENHVTSDKYYNQPVDNPLGLKIKALMVLPIVKDKNVVAIVKIWKGIRQRKTFAKKDEESFYAFAPILLKMFELEYIDKEDQLQLLEEKRGNRTKKLNATVMKSKKNAKKSTEDSEVLTKLEKEIVNLRVENKAYKEKEKLYKKEGIAYKKSIKTLALLEAEMKKTESKNKENILLLQAKVDTYDKELSAEKVKYNELEDSFLELYTESQEHRNMIQKLQEDLQWTHKENAELHENLKEKRNSIKSIKELKSDISLLSQSQAVNEDGNIESMLQRVDNVFEKNEHIYMLFELMIYAFSSKKGVLYIEEVLEQSKVVQKIIDGYYFKGDVKVYNEKYRISDIVNHIKGYEKNIFSKNLKFNIIVDKIMPSSLVFDAFKIQSIILHLLLDLYQFIEHDHDVNIHFSFKKKLLYIEIGGVVHKKNNLFKKIFKQTKLGGDEKDRIGLQLSKKIITRLKGNIDYLYEDAHYKFIVTVPAQVIKM